MWKSQRQHLKTTDKDERCTVLLQELCAGAGKLNRSQPLQAKPRGCADSAVYCCVTMPSRHAVRSTANPEATNEAEKLH